MGLSLNSQVCISQCLLLFVSGGLEMSLSSFSQMLRLLFYSWRKNALHCTSPAGEARL